MAQFETSIVIERPRQDVFGFVLDLEHAIGIDPDIESTEKTSTGPTGAGTEFSVRQKVPPFGRISDGVSRFTVVDPPRPIVIESTRALASARGPHGCLEASDDRD